MCIKRDFRLFASMQLSIISVIIRIIESKENTALEKVKSTIGVIFDFMYACFLTDIAKIGDNTT